MQAWPVVLAAVLVIAAIIYGTNLAYSATDSIVINEVELNPAGTDMGFEMVELYNPTNTAIDVEGWTLSSTAGRTREVTIGGSIAPGSHALFSISQQWLDNEGEVVLLKDKSGAEVDRTDPLSDTANDPLTWQRSPDGSNNWVFASQTIDQINVGTSASPPQQPREEEQPAKPSPPASGPEQPPVEDGDLRIVFIDVGQGDSILIIMPDGKAMLIDGGDRDQSGKVLSTLEEYNVAKLDLIVATHPHADHIGGLIDVIHTVEVIRLVDSGQVHSTKTFEDLLDAIDANQVPIDSVHEDDALSIDPSVSLQVLNPQASLPEGADDEEQFNDNSVVVKLTYGEFSALFTGDLQEANEERLVQERGSDLDADVLKVGHHGSRTSSTTEFLHAVSPEVAIISAGENNTYGHPHKETLLRLSASGVKHDFRTYSDGTLVLTSDGSSDYTIESLGSRKTVVVPEFNFALLIAAVSVLSTIIAGRGRLWRQSGPA